MGNGKASLTIEVSYQIKQTLTIGSHEEIMLLHIYIQQLYTCIHTKLVNMNIYNNFIIVKNGSN